MSSSTSASRRLLAFGLAALVAGSAGPAAANRDLPGRQRPIVRGDGDGDGNAPQREIRGSRRGALAVPDRDVEDHVEHAREGAPDDVPQAVLEPRDPVPPPVADGDLRVGLTLDDAIRLALAHALEIRSARIDTRAAEARVGAARGAFDPVLNASASRNDVTRPTANPFLASESLTDSYSVSLEQRLWTGATYEVGVNVVRNESPASFFSFSPYYDTDLLLRYTQPLLRGLGRDANRLVLDQAIRTAIAADRNAQATARDVIRDVVLAYWELVFGLEDIEVRRASLGLAQELLRKNRIMVDVGTLAPLEITQAEASVAARELDIITTRAAAGNAADELRRLMGVEEGSRWWEVELVPLDEPAYVAETFQEDEAIRTGLRERTEVEAADLAVESARLGVAAARDALLPRLDLDVSLDTAGLAGVGNLPDEDPLVDADGDGDPTNDTTPVSEGLQESFEDTFGFDFRTWSAALVFSQPLRNRAAKGNFLAERLELEAAELDKVVLEQTITLEVRRALRDLESARERITASDVARRLQERTLEAEIKKFENGLSTNFEVLQFQTDLQEAESAALRALIDYLQAIADVRRSRGTLLRDYGLTAPR